MLEELIKAEEKAGRLFQTAIDQNFITAGQTEKLLNGRLYDLAFQLFGIKKYWHKRIVRSGVNTLLPYRANPEDRVIEAEDIIFFDFGPVFEEWEADFGRTFVLGSDPTRLKLQRDVEAAWYSGSAFIRQNYDHLTGADVFAHTKSLAKQFGWQHTVEHSGHLIGQFPHERLIGDDVFHYLHPNNDRKISEPAADGSTRHWIYEIHFIDPELKIGSFFEQLLRPIS